MSSQIDKWRMRGDTLLNPDYFNGVWQDVDLRLLNIEDKGASFDEVVRQFTEFGLTRIEEVLRPTMEQLQVLITDVNGDIDSVDAEAVRLQGLIDQFVADVAQVMSDQQGLLIAFNQQIQNDFNNAVANGQTQINDALVAAQTDIDNALATFPKPWRTLSSDTLLEVGGRYRLDMSSPVSLTLPSDPVIGRPIYFALLKGRFDDNTLTVLRNGKKINGRDDDMVVTTSIRQFQMEFTGDDTVGWWVTGSDMV